MAQNPRFVACRVDPFWRRRFDLEPELPADPS
jgi:hypothetical protein